MGWVCPFLELELPRWKRKRHVTQHAQMTYWRNVKTLATQPHVRETELLPTLELQHHTIDSSLQ